MMTDGQAIIAIDDFANYISNYAGCDICVLTIADDLLYSVEKYS